MTDYRTPMQRQFDRVRYSPIGRKIDKTLALTFIVVLAVGIVASVLGLLD